eukprot:5582320-Amphidinium_carterae.1
MGMGLICLLMSFGVNPALHMPEYKRSEQEPLYERVEQGQTGGSHAPAEGEIGCIDCEVGAYADEEGMSRCLPCSPGMYSNDGGAEECLACASGHYANESGGLNCNPCPAGRFSALEGQPECAHCSPGEEARDVGAIKCDLCAAGFFAAAGGTCSECYTGSYSPLSGATSCVTCHLGHYSASIGSSGCVKCNEGSFAAEHGMTGCSLCQDILPGGLCVYEEDTRNHPLQNCARFILLDKCSTACKVHRSTGQPWSLQPRMPLWQATRSGAHLEVRSTQALVAASLAHRQKGRSARSAGVGHLSTWCKSDMMPSSVLIGRLYSFVYEAQGVLFHCPKECGEGLICLGMDVLSIQAGYAWDHKYSVWECSEEKACPGGEPGRCKPGRDEQSVGCARCSNGMVSQSDGSCAECHGGEYVLPFVCILVAVCLVLFLYLRYDSPSKTRPRLSILLITASFAQLVTMVQQIGIVSLIRVRWTNPLISIFDLINSVAFLDLEASCTNQSHASQRT